MTHYWFRPKRYGYGATPVTWQGWALTLAASGLVVGSIMLMKLLVDRTNFVAWMIWAAFIAAVVVWFVRLCRERTDGEWHWRWGNRSGAAKT